MLTPIGLLLLQPRPGCLVEMLFTLYNNHADVFVAVYINFFITRAGHIHKIVRVGAVAHSRCEVMVEALALAQAF